MRRNIGQTYMRKHTNTATGLPGRPKTRAALPSARCLRPKASGLPGFMRTVQKPTSPSAASTVFTTSKSPRDRSEY